MRSFALTVLGGAASHGGDEATRSARALLDSTLASDLDPALRDLSARLLSRLPADDTSVGLLAHAGREDAAWNVRYTAIETLAKTARAEGDYIGEQFMQWFLKEQVEEVSSMKTLLNVAKRAGDNLFHLEDYLARETVGDAAADPTAPPAAGGAV